MNHLYATVSLSGSWHGEVGTDLHLLFCKILTTYSSRQVNNIDHIKAQGNGPNVVKVQRHAKLATEKKRPSTYYLTNHLYYFYYVS
jgi:hypothetical protein